MSKKTPRSTFVLANKLRAIRLDKGLSQSALLKIVAPGLPAAQRARISQWEAAKRYPYSDALIRYARFAQIPLEELLLDELELPARLNSAAAKRIRPGRRKQAAVQTDGELNGTAQDLPADDKKMPESEEQQAVPQVPGVPSNVDEDDNSSPPAASEEQMEKITVSLPVEMLDELDRIYFGLSNRSQLS